MKRSLKNTMKKHFKVISMFAILIIVIVGIIILQGNLSNGVCPFCGQKH